MPSPFPGMNPYLEHPDGWADFHSRFVPALADAVADRLDPNFFVLVEQQAYIRELPDGPPLLTGRPDVAVVELAPPAASHGTAVAGTRSAVWSDAVDVLELPYIEVHDKGSNRIVSVIELLSPTNKYSGPDREQYLNKRRRLVRAADGFVELDLLRAGPRMPWRDLPACDYLISVTRRADWPRAELWPLGVRDPLPVLPIPMPPGVVEPLVDLKLVLDQFYDRGRHARMIYRRKLNPPLAPADAAWAAEILAGAGVTSSA